MANAKGNITISVVENGADAVQQNLYGYASPLRVGSNDIPMMHTPTGFAAVGTIGGEEGETGVLFLNVDTEFPVGIYGISFRVKVKNISGLENGKFKIFATQEKGTVIGGRAYANNNNNCYTDVWYDIEYKFQRTSPHIFYIYISGTATAKILVEVENLKIERGEDTTVVCTPFNGLAEDNIPQGQNLLLDTNNFSNNNWRGYTSCGITNVENALHGCMAARYNYGMNVDPTWGVNPFYQAVNVKPNTFYTISFYAKGKGSVNAHVSYGGNDGTARVFWWHIQQEAYYAVKTQYVSNGFVLESDWKLYKWTFYNDNLTRLNVVWQLSSARNDETSYMLFAMPKLEEGEKPTEWQQNEADRKGEKGEQGNKGDDAVTYQIDILKAEFTHGGVYNFAKIQARAYKITGNERQELTTDGSPCLKVDDGDDSYGFDYSEEKSCYELEEEIGKDVKSLSVFISPNPPAPLSSALYSVSVPVIFDGRVGAIARPCGQWSASATYVWDDNFRDIVIYKDDYYAVKKEGLTLSGVIPTNTNNWEKASNFRFVATDLLLSQLAYINNLGVKNLLVYDSNGAIKGGMTATNTAPDGSSLGLGDVRFWLGGNNPQTAPARVYESGAVYFNSGTFEGVIKAKRFAYATSGNNVIRESFTINPANGICNFVVNTGITITLPLINADIEGLQIVIASNVYYATTSKITIRTGDDLVYIYYDNIRSTTLKFATGSITLCVIAGSWRVISAASSNITTS